MAIIKILKEENLIGETSKESVYPVTHIKAVYDSNNRRLDDILNDIRSSSGKVTLKLEANTGTQEIVNNKTEYKATFTGSASIQYYGDIPDEKLDVSSATLTTYDGRSLKGQSNNNTITFTDTLPVRPGNFTYKMSYNNKTSNNATVALALRSYYGYATAEPTDVTTLRNSFVATSINREVTVSAINMGMQYIYFALPSNLKLTNVLQKFGAVTFEVVKTIPRGINNDEFDYTLYRSKVRSDSSKSVTLNIS